MRAPFTPGTVVWVRVRTVGLKGAMGAWLDPCAVRIHVLTKAAQFRPTLSRRLARLMPIRDTSGYELKTFSG
jgi:hypothetical protein